MKSCALSAWIIGVLAGCRPHQPGGTSRQEPRVSSALVVPDQVADAPEVVPRFTNVAADVGVEFTYYNDAVADRYFLPEVMGGGAAWLDYDRDGRLDLYLTNGCRLKDPDATQTEWVNRLYRNLGDGSFEEVTFPAAAWHNGFGQGCAVGDFDADGFPDLYLTNYGANVLLHNQGDGTFQNVTEAAGVGDEAWGSSALWLDLDGDEDLDLFVANYMDVTFANLQVCYFDDIPGYCGPGEYEGVADLAYVNQGDGTFVESAQALGLAAAGGKGLAVVAIDFDNDLCPEIYVANDMMPNFLFTQSDVAHAKRPQLGAGLPTSPKGAGSGDPRTALESGDPRTAGPGGETAPPFAEVALAAGCAVSGVGLNEASMGLACADFDADGLVDVFMTHYYRQKNTLYRNLGGLVFQDDSNRTRIAATSFETIGFGTVAFDYDRDGAADLFIANGHVLGPKYDPCELRPQLLRNDGRGRFNDISDLAGPYFQDLWLGRGAAGADYDNDGDLDLVVSHLNRPVALLRNDTRTGRHFLGIELLTASRIPPVGGRVVVTVGRRRQVVPLVAGGSYLSSGDPRLLFGLGDAAGPVRVEVHWPGGEVDTFENLAVDRYWRIMAGRDPEPWPVAEGQAIPLPADFGTFHTNPKRKRGKDLAPRLRFGFVSAWIGSDRAGTRRVPSPADGTQRVPATITALPPTRPRGAVMLRRGSVPKRSLGTS